jgi:Protein of unknown function (DUF3159)
MSPKVPAAPIPDDSVSPIMGDGAEPASFREALSVALRKSGAGQLAPGEAPSARALLGAMGGIRGLLESILPTLAFLVIFTVTHDLVVSVVAPVALALVFLVVRAGARSSMSSAIVGAVLIAVTAALSLITNRPENNFVLGIWLNIAFLVAMLVSQVVRKPLVGVVVGLLTGNLHEWLSERAKRRVSAIATWFWVGLFGARCAVEIPLYFAANASALAVTKLLMGVPLYAVVLWITWLLVRTAYDADGGSVAENRATKVS